MLGYLHDPTVLFAYIDETGDSGDSGKQGSSTCYGLGCVLLPADRWGEGFDSLVQFRRRIRDTYGVPMRAELKANYLIRGTGPLRKLNLAPAQRSLIYRAHLRAATEIHARAFAVVIDKRASSGSGRDYFLAAWETLVQRLERTMTAERTQIMVIHDEGENDAVRKIIRKARRHLTAPTVGGGGSHNVTARGLLEDPVPRGSHQSYLIQLADLVAYAGWRSYIQPSESVAKVVPSSMWSELGEAIHAPVNKISGGTPGVVARKV